MSLERNLLQEKSNLTAELLFILKHYRGIGLPLMVVEKEGLWYIARVLLHKRGIYPNFVSCPPRMKVIISRNNLLVEILAVISTQGI